MADSFLYFESHHAIAIHDWIINNSEGRHGIVDISLLESPLQMIKVDDYYPDLVCKVTHLCYSINKNHAFEDGNKRSSIALSSLFLQINGFGHVVKRFVIEMENIAVLVADNEISKAVLQDIIESLLFEDEYSEKLKLEILRATISFEERARARAQEERGQLA